MKLPICSLIAKTLALGTLTVSVMMAAKPAEAAIFNVGGTNYDITTVTGTYNDLKSQIHATPWWNNHDLSRAVVSEIGLRLGVFPITQNPVESGPFVAVSSLVHESGFTQVWGHFFDNDGFTISGGIQTYAVLAPAPAAVPEPLTILGSITAAGFGVAFKRKKNSTKE